MKSAIYILATIFLIGCSDQKNTVEAKRPLVFTSIPPQAGLAKAIAGDLVEVRTLVGEGQSPHSYEPTARQLARLGEADALFTIGVPFETRLMAKIAPLYPNVPIVATQTGIDPIEMPHVHHGEACTHEHGTADPHVWLNPDNALLIAQSIFEKMVEIDPGQRATYQKNFDTLAGQLQALDEEIMQMMIPCKGSRFYVFHPSFGYFASAYGLEQVPVEIDGKSPSPQQLAALITQARSENVKVIFVQKQFPLKSAKAVANAIDGNVVQLNPLAEDVIANLREIAETLLHALKP